MTEADQLVLAECLGRLRSELQREFEARFAKLERERRTAGPDPESLFTHHIPRFLPRVSER